MVSCRILTILRVLIGCCGCLHRAAPLHLIGPAGFAERVEHRLRSYTLNLLDARSVDFVIIAAEFNGAGFNRICEFRAREAFRRHDLPEVQQSPGLLLDEDEFRIDGDMLDRGIPCLAFALTEKLRVNVWREGLRQLELPVGPWLREAKRAVRQGAPADRQISIRDDLSMPLGVLRQGALRDVSDFLATRRAWASPFSSLLSDFTAHRALPES